MVRLLRRPVPEARPEAVRHGRDPMVLKHLRQRLAGFSEGDEGDGAESELPSSSADDESLDPASGPGRLDGEVEAVAVGVSSWRGGTDEGGRESLVGMAASALGSWRFDSRSDYSSPSRIICGKGAHFTGSPRPGREPSGGNNFLFYNRASCEKRVRPSFCLRPRGERGSADGTQRSQDDSDRHCGRGAGAAGVHGACLPVMRASTREEMRRISSTSRSSSRLFSIHSR